MSDNRPPIKITFDEWSLYLGRFILMFGSIEEITYLLLDKLATEKIFENASHLTLVKRTNILNEIIKNGEQLHPKTKKELKKTLDTVIKLAEKRNILAHNPLSFDVSRDITGLIEVSEKIKHALKPQKNVHLKELISLSEEVERLADKLNDLFNEVLVQINVANKQ